MDPESSDKELELTFHNKINPHYRQIHVDGAIGGITPKGLINISFYAERFPVPQSTTYSVVNGNQLGEKIADKEQTKHGIIREYEFGVYMNLEAARDLKTWLDMKLREFENLNVS